MKFSAQIHLVGLILASGLVSVLALYCGRIDAMPQFANGGDVLSIAFGDAREVISRAAVQKADSYFHGGIECEGEDEGKGEGKGEGEVEGKDWWRWINDRICVPHEHRHLEGAKAVELMPWFWAAVRSDPHNAEAWAEAWYVAAHAMKDRELAARVIAEAKAKNPDSIEIAFTEGRAFYDGGKGDLAAARIAFARTIALGDAKEAAGGKLSVREEEAYRFAGNYLKHLEREDK